MEQDLLIKVEHLSKKYCKDLKTSLWYGAKDVFSSLRDQKDLTKLRPKEFWAVRDISFELKRGECLGLIGHNGAGKSTLLKILNGLINPDAGSVTMRGRVGALIELGAGFNTILTGRENIYNNGAVLGFTRKEIKDKIEDIIDFSEIREFIDMPVQNYSSGMKVRLGFAIAMQMEPDILIIDEVLAVGDLGFVLKCFNSIDIMLKNTAVIFVSHNMPMVSRICNKIILMDKGQSRFQGENVSKAIDLYYAHFANNETNIIYDSGEISLENIAINSPSSKESELPQIQWNEDLEIDLNFKFGKLINTPLFEIIIFDKEQRPVAIIQSDLSNKELDKSKSNISFRVTHRNLQLSKGIYSINISVKSHSGSPLLRINGALAFQVIHDKDIWQPFLLKSNFQINNN